MHIATVCYKINWVACMDGPAIANNIFTDGSLYKIIDSHAYTASAKVLILHAENLLLIQGGSCVIRL